jgi:hypothetical protein
MSVLHSNAVLLLVFSANVALSKCCNVKLHLLNKPRSRRFALHSHAHQLSQLLQTLPTVGMLCDTARWLTKSSLQIAGFRHA